MLAILTPLIFAAAIIVTTLGISFACMELVLRMIARGLATAAVTEPAKQPGNRRQVAQGAQSERAIKTRLRAVAAQ